MADDKPNFDIVEDEHPFSFRGTDYVLREPSEEANIKHQRTQFRNAKMKDGKVNADLADAVEAPSALVGECVFVKDSDKPVGAKTVKGWPRRLVRDLYDKAREMAGADTAEDIDAQISKLQELRGRAADPKKQSPGTGAS